MILFSVGKLSDKMMEMTAFKLNEKATKVTLKSDSYIQQLDDIKKRYTVRFCKEISQFTQQLFFCS